jgi:hypothetical protein
VIVEKTRRVLRLSECAPVRIRWLWDGRLPAGKLTLFDGDPHQGKSLLTLDLVARLTSGRPLPEADSPSEPVAAVLIGTEDRPEDTVVPRLLAAGADLGRVTVFQGTSRKGVALPPRFPEDLPELRETLYETGARLVMIDPLSAVLKGSAGGPEVRRALEPLAETAAETGAAVILVRHLNKGSTGQQAIFRGGGSIAIIGVARTAFLIGVHPHDARLRVLACTKNNLGEPAASLGFRITPSPNGEPVVNWTGPIEISAEELVPPRLDNTAVRRASQFLRELLDCGPCSAEDAYRQALTASISERTLCRAKRDLAVVSEQRIVHGRRVWYWRMPDIDSSRLTPLEKARRVLAAAQKESDQLMRSLRDQYNQRPRRKRMKNGE